MRVIAILSFCVWSIHALGAESGHSGSTGVVKTLNLHLIDSSSAMPLPKLALQIDSDNGRKCVKKPCATNGKHWEGSTNKQGIAIVPGNLAQYSMRLMAVGYRGVDLNKKATKISTSKWIVKLDKDSISVESR